MYRVESGTTVVFLGRHFLFTCSDTFVSFCHNAQPHTRRQTDNIRMLTADRTACSIRMYDRLEIKLLYSYQEKPVQNTRGCLLYFFGFLTIMTKIWRFLCL